MSQQINLFNPIFLKQKKIFTAVHMAQTLGVLLLGALAIAAYGTVMTSDLEKHAAAGKAALAAREARLAEVVREFPPREKSKEMERELANKLAEVRALQDVQGVLQRGDIGNTAGYSEYFRAFARQNVHGVWLTGVNIVGAGKDIGMEGKALQPELVPGYIQRLTREAVLQGKTFGTLEIGRPPAPAVAGGGAESATTPAASQSPFVEFKLLSQPATEVRK